MRNVKKAEENPALGNCIHSWRTLVRSKVMQQKKNTLKIERGNAGDRVVNRPSKM